MSDKTTYETLKEKFKAIVEKRHLGSEEIIVKAQTLTPDEAIGDPEDKDYPLYKGRERIVEAKFRGAKGQAFTDMFGNYQGTLNQILALELNSNFRRAVFISTLNAVLRHLGIVEGTVHCRDQEPQKCSQILVEKIKAELGNPNVALIGFQPRMAEFLAKNFSLRISDLDEGNIGQKKFGVLIQGSHYTREIIEWCDLLLITGSTVVNDTMTEFLGNKPVLFYGITIAGAASLLGLNRFCPLGK